MCVRSASKVPKRLCSVKVLSVKTEEDTLHQPTKRMCLGFIGDARGTQGNINK